MIHTDLNTFNIRAQARWPQPILAQAPRFASAALEDDSLRPPVKDDLRLNADDADASFQPEKPGWFNASRAWFWRYANAVAFRQGVPLRTLNDASSPLSIEEMAERPIAPLPQRPGVVVLDPQNPLDADVLNMGERQKAPHSLVPEGTPMVVASGTYADFRCLPQLRHYFNPRNRGAHPFYVLHMPEVRTPSGINAQSKLRRTASGYPADVMVLRDLGDFRWQLLKGHLDALEALWRDVGKASSATRQQALGDFFNIPKSLREILLPVTEDALIQPAFSLPERLRHEQGFKQSLSKMLQTFSDLNRREVEKLRLPGKSYPDVPEIIDSNFLFQYRLLANKARKRRNEGLSATGQQPLPLLRLNKNATFHYPNPHVINLRPVGIEQIAEFETYWLYIEDSLRQALIEAFKKHKRQFQQEWNGKTPNGEDARVLARQLLAVLLPTGIAIPHSQGELAVHLAVMKAITAGPKSYDDLPVKGQNNGLPLLQRWHHQTSLAPSRRGGSKAVASLSPQELDELMLFNQNSLLLRQPKPPRALYRSGLLVGLEDARSAPMNGIVPIPPWAYPIKEVIDQAGLLPEKLKPIFCSMVQHSIWTAFQLTGPGIREMRQGHPLLVKFNDSLDKLAERSRFPQGFTALSVTNTNDPFVEPNSSLFGSPERRRSPNVFTLGINFPNSWVKPSGRQAIDERFRYFPKPIRSAVHKKLGYFEKVYQRHGFTVGRPDVVNRILPAAFLNYPSQFIDLMQPSNFEPMQIQMLKHFQSVLTQPDSVMSQALLQHDYFDVMQVLQALYHQTTPLQQSLRKEITEAIEAMLAFAEENSRKIASAPIPQKAPLLNALRLLLEDKSGAFDALHSRVEVLREYLDR